MQRSNSCSALIILVLGFLVCLVSASEAGVNWWIPIPPIVVNPPQPQPQPPVVIIQPQPNMPSAQRYEAPPSQPSSVPQSPAERLGDLKKLFDSGVITEDEYTRTKQRILDEL